MALATAVFSVILIGLGFAIGFRYGRYFEKEETKKQDALKTASTRQLLEEASTREDL